MIYETKKYIEILNKLDITTNQFLFCWLLYNKQWEELKVYLKGSGKFTAEEIRDLDKKGVIHNMNRTDENIIPANIIVTELFNQEMIITPDDAWDELWKVYPNKLKINNDSSILYASKGIKLSEEIELKARYQKHINLNFQLHNQIITLTQKWAEKNGGYATMKIDKYIISEYWKDIETERDTNAGTAIF